MESAELLHFLFRWPKQPQIGFYLFILKATFTLNNFTYVRHKLQKPQKVHLTTMRNTGRTPTALRSAINSLGLKACWLTAYWRHNFWLSRRVCPYMESQCPCKRTINRLPCLWACESLSVCNSQGELTSASFTFSRAYFICHTISIRSRDMSYFPCVL